MRLPLHLKGRIPFEILSIARGVRDAARLARYEALGELDRISVHPHVVRGEGVRLTGHVDFGSEPFLISLGSQVTIADGVRFITHDGGARVARRSHPGLHRYGAITVGDNSFIGIEAIIMPGVSIGSDCVVGARAVVTRDVPPGTVVAGMPAKPLKTTAQYIDGLISEAFWWESGEYGDEWRRALVEKFSADASRPSAS